METHQSPAMKLTVSNVRKFIDDPSVEITADELGIRIYRKYWDLGHLPVVADIMRAALHLDLHPNQIQCLVKAEKGTRYSTFTEDPDDATVDVRFLYRRC